MSRTTLRAAVRAASITLVTTAALAGCGSDDENAAQQPQDVVAGVVLEGEGGAPTAGLDLELLVWPSPQGAATAPAGEAPELIRVDEQTTSDDGTFHLKAMAADLSPHASSDGQVGLQIREVGADGEGLRTTVRLSRGEGGNGEFTVHSLEGLELTPAQLGSR